MNWTHNSPDSPLSEWTADIGRYHFMVHQEYGTRRIVAVVIVKKTGIDMGCSEVESFAAGRAWLEGWAAGRGLATKEKGPSGALSGSVRGTVESGLSGSAEQIQESVQPGMWVIRNRTQVYGHFGHVADFGPRNPDGFPEHLMREAERNARMAVECVNQIHFGIRQESESELGMDSTK
jgi:hypothetical protein